MSNSEKLNWLVTTQKEALAGMERDGGVYDKVLDFMETLDEDILTLSSGYAPEDPKADILGRRIVKEGTVKDAQHRGGAYIYIDLIEWRGIPVVVDQSTETIISISAKDKDCFEAEVSKIIAEDGVESLYYNDVNHDRWI